MEALKTFRLRFLIHQLRKKHPVTLARVDEQEWDEIFAGGPLGEALHQVLQSRPKYYLGRPLRRRQIMHRRQVLEHLQQHDLLSLPWVQVNELWRRSMHVSLGNLIQAFRGRSVIMVGPSEQRYIHPMIPYKDFVVAPPRNVELVWRRLVRDVLHAMDNVTTPTVISVSAGKASLLVLDALYQKLGRRHTLIDTGELWDDFASSFRRRKVS